MDPMDIENITAPELLAAANKSASNGKDKPKFEDLLDGLKRLPRTEERLSFEFLDLANRSLQRRADPSQFMFWATAWTGSIEQNRVDEYLGLTERCTFKYFELLGQMETLQVHPFAMPLSSALVAVRKLNRRRFTEVLEGLKRMCNDRHLDPRRTVLNEVERAIAQAEQRLSEEGNQS